MNATEHELLRLLLAEIEAFAEVPDCCVNGPNKLLKSMAAIGIPYTPSRWIVNISPARKMAFVRAVRKLERRGELERIVEPYRDRTTHVVPSASGISATMQQLGQSVDRAAIAEGLARTKWGKPIVKQLM